MSRINANNKKANGTGSIRKITSIRNGKEYTYWQARYTAGYDPGTGKQLQRSITGKTQKEVSQKLKQVTFEIDQGTYQAPTKMIVGEWLDTWKRDYLTAVKPRTADSYITTVDNHLKPTLGALKLEALKAHEIQKFYNSLQIKTDKRPELSAKSIRNIHGVLHKALQQAVDLGYLRLNPATACKLPRIEKPDIKPLDADQIKEFIKKIKGTQYENVYIVTLFTGMREGEVLGLTWDCVDFENGIISINKQLQRQRKGGGKYQLVSTKNGKSRYITVAPFVLDVLRQQQEKQKACIEHAGSSWEDTYNLVFTNELGHNLSAQTVYLHFKKIVEKVGCPNARFHDLRHTFAVASLQAGDDIKTVQENLGHQTAAFTLDVYGHVTKEMKRESAARMEQFISSVSV